MASDAAFRPDQTMTYGDHADHVIDLYLPAEVTGPTVVVVHGGFWRPRWDRDHARAQARAIAELGHRCALIEYRRTPGAPDDAIDDALAAIAAISDEPVILIGHSAGGHLVLALAQRIDTHGVIALAPVADLHHAHALNLGDGAVAAFLGAPPDARADLDPARSPAPSTPVIVIHGTHDDDVPLSVSEALHAAWDGGCELIVLPDTGHMELIDPTSAAWGSVVEAIAALSAR